MGKKYIIKLDDNNLAYTAIMIDGVPYIKPLQLLPYTEPDLDAVRKEAYQKGWKAAEDNYDSGYSDGYDAGLDEAIASVAHILDCLMAYRNIVSTGDCNNCKNKDCEWKPKLGQLVRYNCPHYKAEDEA